MSYHEKSNMKQRILFSFLLIGLLLPLHAQIKGHRYGHGQQLRGICQRALYSLPDSVLIAGTITNRAGEFSLDARFHSDAIVQVSFIGYQTSTVPAQPDQKVLLHPDTTLLGEVVVNGDLPRIRVRDDALVASVENTVLSKAGTANGWASSPITTGLTSTNFPSGIPGSLN